jgi:type VII secretion-associated serine protease mycosin
MRRLVPLAALLILAATLPAAAASAAPHAPRDPIRDAEYWLDDYGIREAWSVTRGAGVTIAVIDTGIAAGVPELEGAVVDGADFSGIGSADGRQPVGSDGDEHGTLVASLAAGRGRGVADGILGAAPEATLLSLSIGFDEGTRDSDIQIAEAVTWAVDHGADVINMSLTRNTLDWPESWDRAFLYALENDVVVVAAAGNRGSGTVEVGAPATMPGVLTVAGVDAAGNSSWDASSQGITIGVSAPSEQLVGVLPGGGYVTWGGTSGATPIVSGIVALVRAAYPDLDAANVINRVLATARDAGSPGTDFLYGFGLVDAAAAVSADVPAVTENPMGDLAEWIRVNRRAEPTAPATPTPLPDETAPPVAAGPADPTGTLLPSLTLLELAGLPALALAILLFIGGGLGVGAVRQFRSSRTR